jgi:hypothetical protein
VAQHRAGGRSRLRSVLAVFALALAGACVVLALVLVGLTTLCDAAGPEPQAQSCTRQLMLIAMAAGGVAVGLGLVGALAIGLGRD